MMKAISKAIKDKETTKDDSPVSKTVFPKSKENQKPKRRPTRFTPYNMILCLVIRLF